MLGSFFIGLLIGIRIGSLELSYKVGRNVWEKGLKRGRVWGY